MTAINQGLLVDVLRLIFNGKTILQNVRSDAGIKNPITDHYFELDIWIPELSLSFEFQDTHHYTTAWYSQFPLEDISEQDRIKRELAHSRGITIIQVPCWWDGSPESLQELVYFQRPELNTCIMVRLTPVHLPISLNPPLNYFFPGSIPDVGELMLASLPPNSFPSSPSLPYYAPQSSWWLGEKYDGIRFCWNSTSHSLYSRTGTKLYVPEITIRAFPNTFLDGELWYGRGCFPETQKFFHSPVTSIDWASLRAICFDNVSPEMNYLPFEKRYGMILDNIPFDSSFLINASRVWCDDTKLLIDSLNSILGDEGEGIMLRSPNSIYEHGRSSSLLKLKGSRGDKEALVVGVKDGTIQLQLADGLVFEVQEDSIYLQRGDVVTFSYANYTSLSAPFRPKITRVRYDYAWDEILNDHHKQSQSKKNSQPSEKEIAIDMRGILEEFARNLGFDPLIPNNWYLRRESEFNVGELLPILDVYGNYRQALLRLFPEIGLDQEGFVSLNFGNWDNINHRKKYFEAFAAHYDFDPRSPSNWYCVTLGQLRNAENSYKVCQYHDGSFVQALIDLYPELKLIRSEFIYFNSNIEEFDMRDFMENFAWESNFDPKIAENWYSKGIKFRRAKNSKYVLNSFKGNFVNAVTSIFPDIGLVKGKFNEEHWSVPANQRDFFVSFAKNIGCDPLVPATWYSINLIDTLSMHEKTPLAINNYGNIYNALIALLPELRLDESKFITKEHFQEWKNRKAFFNEFAHEHNFDPSDPQNWYTVSRTEFLSKQNAPEVLRYYNGSYASALVDLYPTIGLKKGRLLVTRNAYWADVKNRRAFFDTFAETSSFDPLNPDNWYKITPQNIKSVINGKSVLVYGGGSLRRLLLEAYPNIGLVKQNFGG